MKMDTKIYILKKLVDVRFRNDEFADAILDLDSINTFLELLPDTTVEQINEDLEMYVQ